MKNLLILFKSITLGLLFITSIPVSAQDAFDQQRKGNTLKPAIESVEMKYEDLPSPVLKVLKTDKYTGLKIDKVYKVGKRKAQREDHYTIRFNTGSETTDVYLDENGNVIDPQDSDNPNAASVN